MGMLMVLIDCGQVLASPTCLSPELCTSVLTQNTRATQFVYIPPTSLCPTSFAHSLWITFVMWKVFPGSWDVTTKLMSICSESRSFLSLPNKFPGVTKTWCFIIIQGTITEIMTSNFKFGRHWEEMNNEDSKCHCKYVGSPLATPQLICQGAIVLVHDASIYDLY